MDDMAGDTRFWWTFTGVGAGVATVITLVASSALPKWSIVTLVVFGALFFTGAAYGLRWIKRTPHPLGQTVRAIAALIVILGGMIALGWRIRPATPGYCLYLAYEFGPRWSLMVHNEGDDSIRCQAFMAESRQPIQRNRCNGNCFILRTSVRSSSRPEMRSRRMSPLPFPGCTTSRFTRVTQGTMRS